MFLVVWQRRSPHKRFLVKCQAAFRIPLLRPGNQRTRPLFLV